MVDIAWRKLIIKVECAKNVDHERTDNVDSDNVCSTVYICRSCPTFRTLTKETVGDHLSEVHHIPSKQLPGLVSGGENKCPSIEVSRDLTLNPLSLDNETTWSANSPPPRPHSPVSPLAKENCQPRKKITVTLNASPTLGLATGPSMETVRSTVANSSHPKNADESVNSPIEGIVVIAPVSTVGPSSSIACPISSPENKKSSQLDYECGSCDLRSPEASVLEEPKSKQHECINSTAEISTKSKMVAGNLNNHEVSCPECGRIFSSKQAKDLHARVHRTPKQCKCALCGSIFRNLGSLKRHAVSVHCIVPESAFPDNPKDKDFDVSVELDSESESGSSVSESSTTRTSRRRKRRSGPPQRESLANTAFLPSLLNSKTSVLTDSTSWFSGACASVNAPPARRRRGRPRRSSARTLKSLDSCYDVNRIAPLTISNQISDSGLTELRGETRYRTILPRPPGGGVSDLVASQPITVTGIHRRRSRRPKKVSLKSVISTLLPNNKTSITGRPSGTTLVSGITAQPQSIQSVYLEHFLTAGNYVALDPATYNAGAFVTEMPSADESSQLMCKPPHVLTVAAAYASQLPPGSIPESSTEDCDALLKSNNSAECDASNSTVISTPVQSAPITATIQIYPTPWMDNQQALLTGSATPVDVTEADHTSSQPSESEIPSSQNISAPTTVSVSQSVQLYPVLGPDGVTTLYYYMATPVEFVQTSTSNEAACSQSVVGSSNCFAPCSVDSVQTSGTAALGTSTTYFCTYANPVTWIPSSTESGEALVTSSSGTHTATYNPSAASDGTFELDQLFTSDGASRSDHVSKSSPVIDDRGSLECPDQRCDLDEKIEVIELDASQFESELNSSVEGDLIPCEPQLPNEQTSRVERGETNRPTLIQNGAFDCTAATTEMVDLRCNGQSSGSFFSCSSSSRAVRSLDSSADSTLADVEYVPPGDLSASVIPSVASTNNDASLQTDSDRSSSNFPDEKYSAIDIARSTSPALEVVQAKVPPFTQLFPERRSNEDQFSRVANPTNDDLQTPPVGMNDMFTFAEVTPLKEQHSNPVEDGVRS